MTISSRPPTAPMIGRPSSIFGRAADDEGRPQVLAERVEVLRQVDDRAAAAGDAALGERDENAALGDVVRAREGCSSRTP